MNKNFNFELEPGRTLNVPNYEKYKKVISIVTPAWNPGEYLLQTAKCILNQTYPYFEWLIVDDGSTKKESLDLLKKIEKMDSRIKVLHKQNEGLSRTRDYGVKNSDKNTEYVVFIDDDDLLNKTWIETAYFSMTSNPDAAWCYSDVVNFMSEEGLWNKIFSSKGMKNENLLVSTAMVKKSAFYDVGGFVLDKNGYYEDWIFWLKLLAKGYYPIHMSYYGFWYRRKPSVGQLNYAKSRHKENMKLIKQYSKDIPDDISGIQFPRDNHDWSKINENNQSFVIPSYKKNGKTNILMIVPWMALGGADKFNLDLLKLIDKDKYSVTLITTQPYEYVWRQQFEEVAEAVYDLSTFIDRKDWLSFINYIIASRNIDIIFNTNSVTGYAMIPYLRAKYPELPIMDYIHMEEWYNRNGGYSRDSAKVSSSIDKTLFCNGGSERIMNEYFGIDKKKLGTVYIGVDADKFDPSKYDKKALREKYEITDDKFVCSLVARIDYQKRPYLLMKIIEGVVNSNKIPNILFVIGGNGPLLNSIKDIAKEKKLNDYIKFLGVTKTPDEVYAISDVTLNCSIKEGLALTAYESLSMGVPVVSADVGGQKELINDKTGVIVPCLQKETDIHDYNYTDEEINNYVEGLIKVYENNDSYKKACRKRILEGFTINHMVENMEKEFDLVIKNHKNDDSLVKHKETCIELINQFFFQNTPEYKWLIGEYYKKVYCVNINDSKSRFLEESGLRDKLWSNPLWRLLVKSPLWKPIKKLFKR